MVYPFVTFFVHVGLQLKRESEQREQYITIKLICYYNGKSLLRSIDNGLQRPRRQSRYI